MCNQNPIQLNHRQQGFSLLMVLAIMMVIAIMVVAGSQSVNTEMRISANDADQKNTFAIAERALRQAENLTVSKIREDKPKNIQDYNDEIKDNNDEKSKDVKKCKAPCHNPFNATGAVWEGSDAFGDNNSKEINFSQEGVSKNPRYIFELLNKDGSFYRARVTVRAWGKNKNTHVTLQSYIDVPA